MLATVFNLIVWLLVIGILWWAGTQILALLAPFIAEPFLSIIRILLIVLLALLLISVVLQLAGMGGGLGFRLPVLIR